MGLDIVPLRVEAGRLALSRPIRYHGGLLLANGVGAATVNVYQGVDAGGTPIDAFYAPTSDNDMHWLDSGILLDAGLYVAIGSNVSLVVLFVSYPQGE
jgi:hypothetical protein